MEKHELLKQLTYLLDVLKDLQDRERCRQVEWKSLEIIDNLIWGEVQSIRKEKEESAKANTAS